MIDIKKALHIVQSKQWGEFKTKMGTPAVKVGDIQFTKHKIPLTGYFIGYAPRVNFYMQSFSCKELETVCRQEKCIAIRFDVPNVIRKEGANGEYKHMIEDLNKIMRRSPRSTFAKQNVILNLDKPEGELSQNLHSKTRYNVKLAFKQGVKVIKDNTDKGFDVFYGLHSNTAKRQGFFPHSKTYYKRVFETLSKYKMVDILTAYHEKDALASWMLFNNKGVLYYPYGGSSVVKRQYMASNLLAWEAIKLGKRLNCKLFDMWGATDNEKDPYWGFTKFKLGYGGELVNYIDSHDYVVNYNLYKLFNVSYGVFWKLAKLIKR